MIIDVNTVFGRPAYTSRDLSLEALLSTLQRYEIPRAVTCSLKGVYYDSQAGNEETLRAADRWDQLIPAATLDPRRRLGWESILEGMLARGVRVFRFFPEEQGWTVDSWPFRDILARLAEASNCVVMVDADGSGTASTIADLVGNLSLYVVLTGVHYSQMGEVLSAMERCSNLLAETHRLATTRAIEVMVEEVGAERVLFGSGAPLRPLPGALNMVLTADISEAEKGAILGGNAARLLALPGETGGISRSPIVPAGPIIDVHAHAARGRWHFPIPAEGLDNHRRFMERYDIEVCILSSTLGVVYDYKEGNSQLLEMIEGEERFLGYVVVNPNDLEGSCAEMDRYYAHPQFVGAKYHGPYSNSYTSDPKTRALIDEVGKRGRPLLIHNAGSGWVTALKEAARANPNLPIIVAHGGQYPGTCEDAIELVSQTENVYLEFCTSAPERGIIRQAIDTVGPERILFGSDQDLIDPGFVLGSYADADLTPREERLIMYENAKRLFGL